MKYIDYMNEHPTENLCWCKPYTNDDETHYLIMYDGKPEVIITPNIEAWRYDGSLTEAIMEQFAREVNPGYETYSHWSDTHIALEAMREIGCHYCPFKNDCDPMIEEMDQSDYR